MHSIDSTSARTFASRGKEIYGQGIWAPSFRYHNGTYYIFANVNRFGLQVFRATNPRGPWSHIEKGLHDLSVLFDDDGKIYAVYGARTIRIAELNQDLTAIVPDTDRVLIQPNLGGGSHFYKIHGKYYIDGQLQEKGQGCLRAMAVARMAPPPRRMRRI
jgi:beta-xylosidase